MADTKASFSRLGRPVESRAIKLEVNYFTSDADLRDALLLRGSIVGAWGYVETFLNEVALQASCEPAYAKISEKPPITLSEKTNYIKNVFRITGPLSKYSGIGKKLIARFERTEEFRNLMAHSRMRDYAGLAFIFEYYRPRKNGVIVLKTTRLTLQEMEVQARHAARIGQFCQRAAVVLKDEKFFSQQCRPWQC